LNSPSASKGVTTAGTIPASINTFPFLAAAFIDFEN
jgi:hypothetical protein